VFFLYSFVAVDKISTDSLLCGLCAIAGFLVYSSVMKVLPVLKMYSGSVRVISQMTFIVQCGPKK